MAYYGCDISKTPRISRSLENIGRAHGIQQKLLWHLAGKLVDCLPSRTMGRDDELRADFLHFFNRRFNDGIENRSRQMKPAQYAMNFICSSYLLGMFYRVDDPGMRTAPDDN